MLNMLNFRKRKCVNPQPPKPQGETTKRAEKGISAFCIFVFCVGPENIYTPPTEGIGISRGMGSSVRPKHLKKCLRLIWNFQRGGGILEKIPSMWEVWIFSGTTHFVFRILYYFKDV